MIGRTSASVVVAALLLAGCGSTDEPPPGGPSASELAGTLVEADDLGTGWAVNAPPEDYGGYGVVTDENRGMVPKLQFCDRASADAVAAASELDWEAFTQVNYETGNDRHLVFVQEFLRSDTADDVRQTYADLASGIRACEGVRSEYPDGEVGTQSSLDVPEVGDDRVGSRELVSEPGGSAATWDIRSLLARDGTTLIGVTVVEIVAPGTEKVLDDGDVRDLMTTITDMVG